MASTLLIYLLLVVAFISPSFSYPKQIKFETIINMHELCNKTYAHHKCLRILKSDDRIATANITGLAEISLDSAYAVGNDIKSLIQTKTVQTTYPRLKKRLDTCCTHYENAIFSLREAKEYLIVHRYVDVANSTTDALEEAGACNGEFVGPPYEPWRLRKLSWEQFVFRVRLVKAALSMIPRT